MGDHAEHAHGGEGGSGFALLVVTLAALGAPLGASLLYLPRIALAKTDALLSNGLAFAAGVMLYLSLAAVLAESKHGFEADYGTAASLCALLAFCVGVGLAKLIDIVGHKVAGHDLHSHPSSQVVRPGVVGRQEDAEHAHDADELDALKSHEDFGAALDDAGKRRLLRSSIMMAAGLFLHSLPEGVLTFFTTREDPSLGAVLGFAVAVHHVPSGLAVAVPCYVASGSKWRALCWTSLAATSAPLGALLSLFAFDEGTLTGPTLGWLFGITAGILVAVVLHEIWPTALRFSRGDVDRAAHCALAGIVAVAFVLGIADATGAHSHDHEVH